MISGNSRSVSQLKNRKLLVFSLFVGGTDLHLGEKEPLTAVAIFK